MPITFRVNDGERVIDAHISGALDAAGMVAGVRDVAALLTAHPGYAVISDQRAVAAPATRAQIDAVIDALAERAATFRGARWAILTEALASYGMMRALSVYAERIPITVQVFRDPAAARAWLAEAGRSEDAPPGG